jgi:TolA-binding protein
MSSSSLGTSINSFESQTMRTLVAPVSRRQNRPKALPLTALHDQISVHETKVADLRAQAEKLRAQERRAVIAELCKKIIAFELTAKHLRARVEAR